LLLTPNGHFSINTTLLQFISAQKAAMIYGNNKSCGTPLLKAAGVPHEIHLAVTVNGKLSKPKATHAGVICHQHEVMIIGLIP
jgi:hypothetical protein